MPVTDVSHDPSTLSLTISAEFAAPVERVWAIHADPRQLEKVYGPPSHPATFVHHDLRVGGRAHYFMTAPDGERYYGWWRITEVEEPTRLAFEDGFAADDTFAPIEEMPVSTNRYEFRASGAGTHATFTSTYDSAEALQQVLDMGVVEGATSAIDQIDALLSAQADPA